MKKIIIFTALITSLFAFATHAAYKEYCCEDEAKLMSIKAAQYYRDAPVKALAAFQNKNSNFFYNDLYVFVIDKRGIFKAHGEQPHLIGKSAYNMKDTKGTPFIQAFLKVEKRGWVEYEWPDNRDTGKIKTKRSYIIKMDDAILGVGFFVNP